MCGVPHGCICQNFNQTKNKRHTLQKVLRRFLMCFFSALEDLMREHMYCELMEKKHQDQAPVAFLSPSHAISGKRAFRKRQTQLNMLAVFSV